MSRHEEDSWVAEQGTQALSPPPDLDIFVEVQQESGRMVLQYTLHSANGRAEFQWRTICGPELRGSPEEYRAEVFSRIDRLRAGVDGGGSRLSSRQVVRQLEGIGHDLYNELFPPEMREAYRRFRDRIETLRLTSNEPWIPWELIKPYDDSDSGAILDDDFLCARFQFTRWLSGYRNPAAEINVRKLVCVTAEQQDEPRAAPHDKGVRLRRISSVDTERLSGARGLPPAKDEREALTRLAAQSDVVDLSPNLTSDSNLSDLLEEGGVGLLHLLCPEDSPAVEAGPETGHFFSPEDLHGRLATQIRQDRPLVFFNASRTARLDWSLTGLGGWVERWVLRSGCGAFVGPQWTVNDRMADEFARIFYGELQAGRTFGEAALEARLQCREMEPSDPTWLAFNFYAHPNGRLLLGEKPLQLPLPPRPQRLTPVSKPVTPVMTEAAAPGALRALLGLFDRRPSATVAFTMSLLPALLGLTWWLGHQAHREREYLVQLSPLSYPAGELLTRGADVLWSQLWKALGTVLLGNSLIAWSTVALLAMIACWLGLSRLRSVPSALHQGWSLVTTVLMVTGALFYALAVSAADIDCGQPKSDLVSQTTFATCSWVKNESSVNDGRRESLNGLLLWLLMATAAGVWGGLRTGPSTGSGAYLRRGLAGVHLLVLVFLLKQMPLAYAYGKWGLKYPPVTVEESCDQQLHQQISAGSCLAFDVSEGAVESTLLLRGRCSEGERFKFWRPDLSGCYSPISRNREVIVSSLLPATS